MNVYVVYAHPNPDSLNHAIMERLMDGLKEAGHEVEVADLYAEGFNPVLRTEDLCFNAECKAAEDVLKYQEKISNSQGMAFVFPIWWFDMPAILKGWFDRVFSRGFAYSFGPQGLKPMLKVKKGLVINTAGAQEGMFKAFGFTEAIKKTLITGTLQASGIYKVEHAILHNAMECGTQARKEFLDKVFELGKGYF